MGDLQSAHTLSDEQQPMQPMIISGFRIAANLILQPENHGRRVRDRQWFHVSMKPLNLNMRNYLLR